MYGYDEQPITIFHHNLNNIFRKKNYMDTTNYT